MESIRDVVGRNSKRLLDASALTNVEIGFRIGVSPQSISRWKSGIHIPDIANLEKLAEVLGVDP